MIKFSSISTAVLAQLVYDYKYSSKESTQNIMESLDTNFEEIQAELIMRGYYDD